METRTIDQLLHEHEFFRGLDPAVLELIAGCGRNVTFEAGAYLFREGDPADHFLILRSGRIALEVHVPHLGPVVIDSPGEGDVVGVSWLFPPHRWQFDGRALEQVRAVVLDGSCLRQKCEEDCRLGYDLMKRFAFILQDRLRSARMRLMDLYAHAGTG